MHKLVFKLKQHTPIIHFQHDQEGATLRATEVKPKLDRFIIERLGNGDYAEGIKVAVSKGWLMGEYKEPDPNKEGDKYKTYALDYKMRIDSPTNTFFAYIETPELENGNFIQKIDKKDTTKFITKTKPYPLFFGNMGKDYTKNDTIKKIVFSDDLITCKIWSSNNITHELEKDDSSTLQEFFFSNCFGTRNGKGFGSFLVDKTNIETEWYYKKFDVDTLEDKNTDNVFKHFKTLFHKLDYWYRAIRGGINLKKKDFASGEQKDWFYIKSLLFLYFKSQSIQWEKKAIKYKFWKVKLEEQIKNRGLTQNDQSCYSNQTAKLTKELLGLSSEEQWQSYYSSITKKNIKAIENGKSVYFPEGDKRTIERYQSPIQFKPIKKGNHFEVYLLVNNNNTPLSEWFEITSNSNLLHLQTPQNFNLKEYLDWIGNKDNVNLNNDLLIKDQFKKNKDSNGIMVFDVLTKIFNQLEIKHEQ